MSTVTANQASHKMKISTGRKKIGAGQIILLFFVLLFTVFCFAPVILVFVSAFTDEMWINQNGFSGVRTESIPFCVTANSCLHPMA